MKAELKSLMNGCEQWLKNFKNLEDKATYKAKAVQYVEIVKICRAYLEKEDTAISTTKEKEELFPYVDALFFRCVELVKKYTLTIKGDTGFVLKKDGSILGDNTYTYIMEGYDQAEYEESDALTIYKEYEIFKTETTARELELTLVFETADQVYVETKKVIIPAFTSTYEINIDVKWLPKRKVDANDPEADRFIRENYDTLLDKGMRSFRDVMQSYLVGFKTDLLKVTSAYTTAYENYTKTVKAAKDVEELRDQWIANAWSIAGGGVLSWLSSANHVLGVIQSITKITEKAKLDEIENVLEDVTQTVLDKAATTGSRASAISEFKLNSPLSFQNNLEKKGINVLDKTLNIINAFLIIVERKKSELTDKSQMHISLDIEKEWELFQQIYSSFLDMESTLTKLWSKEFQISTSLAEDLELLLWAQWIATQKTQKKVRTTRGGGKGGWYEPVGLPLENPIIERFSTLGLLDKLGIDLVTLEWSWDDEYEILRNWAKGFKPMQLF